MASVRSEAERRRAKGLGWRTYRSCRADESPVKGEAICPASAEGNYARTCDTCMACDGAGRPRQVDIVTIAHGGIASLRNYYTLHP